jgi:hypothetical protein
MLPSCVSSGAVLGQTATHQGCMVHEAFAPRALSSSIHAPIKMPLMSPSLAASAGGRSSLLLDFHGVQSPSTNWGSNDGAMATLTSPQLAG